MTNLFTESQYDDWTAELREEFRAFGVDAGEAYDAYPFRQTYDEWGMKPREAVQDYLASVA